MASELRMTRVHFAVASGTTCFQFGNSPSISRVMKLHRDDWNFTQPPTGCLARLADLVSCADSPCFTARANPGSSIRSVQCRNLESGMTTLFCKGKQKLFAENRHLPFVP